jgi:hypothetical protein
MNVLLALASLGMLTDVETFLQKDVLGKEHHFVSLTVSEVVKRYFTAGRTLLVLLPENSGNATRDLIAERQTDEDFQIADVVLEKLNREMRCPLHVFRICCLPTKVMPDTEEIYSSYITFITSQTGDDVTENLITQLKLLKKKLLLNSRAQFLFVVITRTHDIPSDLAFRLLNLSWNYTIGNVLLMISSYSHFSQNVSNNFTSTVKANVLEINLFTFAPYSRDQNCSDVKNVIILDKFSLNGNGEFTHNSDLVLKRNIKNLYGCPLKVVTYDLPPTVVDISSDGNANCTGLEIKILLFILENINATAMFNVISPANKTLYGIFATLVDRLLSGSADLAVGALPLHGKLTASADATVPYFETPIQWVVPCPKLVHRWAAIFTVYPFSVWLSIFLSFVSMVIVMWVLASYSDHFNYTSLQYSFLNMWAVAFEVSVHKMPHTLKARGLFLLWIWISFALCTVFQAFFTTFLVNPGF